MLFLKQDYNPSNLQLIVTIRDNKPCINVSIEKYQNIFTLEVILDILLFHFCM